MENTLLKKKIMRRVYTRWFLNRAKPVVFLQLPLMFIFLAIGHEYVAFKAVASNTAASLGSPSGFIDYIFTAFSNAEPLIAFLAAAVGLFAVLAITSIARNISAIYRKPAILPVEVDK